ncbi:MAG: helix-turn-helix domain-containing protein [Planctomycetota bacterium]
MSEKAITTYKPCELAKMMGIGKQKVYDLIHDGDLDAEDWRTSNSTRPRYRITPEAFNEFREKRRTGTSATSSSQTSTQSKKRKRLHV